MVRQRRSTKTFVPPGALSVHADPDFPRREHLDEVAGCELAALIGVEDFGFKSLWRQKIKLISSQMMVTEFYSSFPPSHTEVRRR